jgi:hypothetical protein
MKDDSGGLYHTVEMPRKEGGWGTSFGVPIPVCPTAFCSEDTRYRLSLTAKHYSAES